MERELTWSYPTASLLGKQEKTPNYLVSPRQKQGGIIPYKFPSSSAPCFHVNYIFTLKLFKDNFNKNNTYSIVKFFSIYTRVYKDHNSYKMFCKQISMKWQMPCLLESHETHRTFASVTDSNKAQNTTE